MSQNPYAQPGRIGGDDFSGIPTPARMSVMAVIALVCGILGCLPFVGIIAILIGVAAIFLISSSKGRVRGTGLAVGGVVLGLIFTGIWVLVGIGAVGVVQEINRTIIVPAQAGLSGLEKGDNTAIRKMLSPTASTNITDAQITQFATDVKAEFGAFKSLPDSMMDLYRAWAKVGQMMGQANQSGSNPQFNNTIPWPVEFEKGQGLLLLEIDHRGGQGTLAFMNIGVAKPDMSKELWLYPRTSAGTMFPTPTPPAPGGSGTPTPPPPDKPETPEKPADPAPGGSGGGGG